MVLIFEGGGGGGGQDLTLGGPYPAECREVSKLTDIDEATYPIQFLTPPIPMARPFHICLHYFPLFIERLCGLPVIFQEF